MDAIFWIDLQNLVKRLRQNSLDAGEKLEDALDSGELSKAALERGRQMAYSASAAALEQTLSNVGHGWRKEET